MMHQPLINPHRWETIVLHSPDFQPIGQIMTNGFLYFSILFFDHRTQMQRTFDDALVELMRGRFLN